MKANLYVGTAFAALATAAACAFVSPTATLAADGASLLAGKVVSSTGEALAGIPIKAHRDNSAVTVAVYTDAKGEYSFPAWSDLTPGSYSVGIELPDFEHAARPVAVSEGKAAKVDFTLKSKPLAYEDATASEIIAGLPGTDQQKTLFSQCSNCHTLQWALQSGRTKEDWIRVVKKMAGRPAEQEAPGTYAFGQKQFIEPLAEYLTSIRGPDSSDKVPFKQRAAADRCGLDQSRRDRIRASPRRRARALHAAWRSAVRVAARRRHERQIRLLHTDHFSYVLGLIDTKTGEGKEIPFQVPKGAGREGRNMTGDGDTRPGAPGGGAHELQFDRQGNVIVGMDNGTVKYDPETGRFMSWSAGRAMFGLDPDGNVWNLQRNGDLAKIDTNSEELKKTTFQLPKNRGIYDTDTDSKGRTNIYIWTEGKIGSFDPRSAEYTEYLTPTPRSGPRRGQIDGQDRLWAAEFYAGQLLMFDPDKKVIKEYPLVNGTKPYTAPYAEPYSASADDKNQIVWTHDFSSSRLYPHRHEHRALDGIHDAVELRGARSEGRHRRSAPDRVGSGLSAAIQAGEVPGTVIVR